ncbi:MAG TPA: response regulator [Chthoniobacterales bacterium]|nr:response regulator [Chthoniobacterales bacterium]
MPKSRRIFVVEDHPTTAQALKMYLETQGYAVTVAENVASALKTAEDTVFDLLLCDLNLPDGTGWELMKKLAARGPVRGIAYTASGTDADIAKSQKAGFFRHLVKGCSTEELTAVIQEALNGASATSAKRDQPKRSR